MMYRNKHILSFVALAGMLALTSCVKWRSDFSTWTADRPITDAQYLLAEANRLVEQAGDKETLLTTIKAYERVLQAEPANYKALYELSSCYLLLGDGYTEPTAEKIQHFRTALLYSERAMYTNSDFKKLIDQGMPVWLAVDSLTIREMEAMMFWTTAVFYYYKDALGPVRQTINYRWITRARKVLERMTELDPDWGGGAVHFTWGAYFLAIPVSVGGDRELSSEYFQKAIETGPNWLLNRWGRAKYFHVKMRNPLLFTEDLQWILDQDLATVSGSYAWNAYFFKDARMMLNQAEEFFE